MKDHMTHLVVLELLLPELGVILIDFEHPQHHKQQMDAQRLVTRAALYASEEVHMRVKK